MKWKLFALLLVAVAVTVAAIQTASAATITVGSSGCDYTGRLLWM